MNILFVVAIDEKNKSGLFMATHNRIKATKYSSDIKEIKIKNIQFYDNIFVKLVKRVMKKEIIFKGESEFNFDGVKYENIYIKNTLINKLFTRVGVSFFQYLNIILNIKLKDSDIVSAHWGDPPGSLAFYLKKIYKIPYILTLHGSDIHTLPYTDYSFKKYITRNMNAADGLCFVSNQLKEEGKKVGWNNTKNEAIVSLNGVDANVFYPLSSAEIEVLKKKEQTNGYIVGFIGNLVEIKRSNFLVNIFEEIQNICDVEITFYIIGNGALKSQIYEDAKKSLLDIRTISYLEHNQIRDYLNIFDCLILPSRNEGTPNIILESQACKTPVVATDVGGVSEIIFNKSALVKNDDENIIRDFSVKVKEIIEGKVEFESKSIDWCNITKEEISLCKRILEKCIIEKSKVTPF